MTSQDTHARALRWHHRHPRDTPQARPAIGASWRVPTESTQARVVMASAGLLADGPELFTDLARVDLESRRHTFTARSMGEHARELRTSRGLTQAQLARRAPLSIDTIARIEKDQHTPSAHTLFKLCGAFQVSVRTFYDGFCRGEVGTDREALDLILLLSPAARELAIGMLRLAVDSRAQ